MTRKKIEEMGTGSVSGFIAPVSGDVKKKKKELDEVMKRHPDIGHGHMVFFLRSLDEASSVDVCAKLTEGRLDEVADMCRAACIRPLVKKKINELVRKKKGGRGFVLYAPHGKGTPSRAVQEFPTRLAAKRAELARFPPKDAEKLQSLRKQIARMMKDPKAKARGERIASHDQGGMTTREQLERKIISKIVKEAVAGRVFGDKALNESQASSEWDSYIDQLSNRIVGSDKRLARLQKLMHRADNPQEKRHVIGKRDQYLDKLEGKIDAMISTLNPLAITLLKRLLANKYRSSVQ